VAAVAVEVVLEAVVVLEDIGHPFQVSFLVAEHHPNQLLYFQLVVTQ
jgi:hypothetical protein